MSTGEIDDPFFAALHEAAKAKGTCRPNPAVGAVLVHRGAIVARGFTREPGRAHAEIDALGKIADAALLRECELYVTLEPCAHHGRTPPCTDAIAKAGIRKVHVALLDLNPAVAGKSKARLAEAGIQTVYDFPEACAREAYLLNRDFFFRLHSGRPWVTLKWAMTLDGKIAARNGDSRWVSGERSRSQVQALRRAHDAVLVGGRTALLDDPELTVREPPVPPRQALRIALDRRGLTPATHRLFRDPHPTLFVADAGTPPPFLEQVRAAGKDVWTLENGAGLPELLGRLAKEREINSILVEGGAGVHGAFLGAGLADEVAVFVAPKVLGDGAGLPPVFPGVERPRMADALALAEGSWVPMGPDMCYRAVVRPEDDRALLRRLVPEA